MTEALPLVVRGLVKTFPGPDGTPFAAVYHLDLELPAEGELAAVVGPDGAGKTTLLRLLAGILSPDAGSISLFGLTPDTEDERFTHTVGFMPQKPDSMKNSPYSRTFPFSAGFAALPLTNSNPSFKS